MNKWVTWAGISVSALAAIDQWVISDASQLHLPAQALSAAMLLGTVLAAIGKELVPSTSAPTSAS